MIKEKSGGNTKQKPINLKIKIPEEFTEKTLRIKKQDSKARSPVFKPPIMLDLRGVKYQGKTNNNYDMKFTNYSQKIQNTRSTDIRPPNSQLQEEWSENKSKISGAYSTNTNPNYQENIQLSSVELNKRNKQNLKCKIEKMVNKSKKKMNNDELKDRSNSQKRIISFRNSDNSITQNSKFPPSNFQIKTPREKITDSLESGKLGRENSLKEEGRNFSYCLGQLKGTPVNLEKERLGSEKDRQSPKNYHFMEPHSLPSFGSPLVTPRNNNLMLHSIQENSTLSTNIPHNTFNKHKHISNPTILQSEQIISSARSNNSDYRGYRKSTKRGMREEQKIIKNKALTEMSYKSMPNTQSKRINKEISVLYSSNQRIPIQQRIKSKSYYQYLTDQVSHKFPLFQHRAFDKMENKSDDLHLDHFSPSIPNNSESVNFTRNNPLKSRNNSLSASLEMLERGSKRGILGGSRNLNIKNVSKTENSVKSMSIGTFFAPFQISPSSGMNPLEHHYQYGIQRTGYKGQYIGSTNYSGQDKLHYNHRYIKTENSETNPFDIEDEESDILNPYNISLDGMESSIHSSSLGEVLSKPFEHEESFPEQIITEFSDCQPSNIHPNENISSTKNDYSPVTPCAFLPSDDLIGDFNSVSSARNTKISNYNGKNTKECAVNLENTPRNRGGSNELKKRGLKSQIKIIKIDKEKDMKGYITGSHIAPNISEVNKVKTSREPKGMSGDSSRINEDKISEGITYIQGGLGVRQNLQLPQSRTTQQSSFSSLKLSPKSHHNGWYKGLGVGDEHIRSRNGKNDGKHKRIYHSQGFCLGTAHKSRNCSMQTEYGESADVKETIQSLQSEIKLRSKHFESRNYIINDLEKYDSLTHTPSRLYSTNSLRYENNNNESSMSSELPQIIEGNKSSSGSSEEYQRKDPDVYNIYQDKNIKIHHLDNALQFTKLNAHNPTNSSVSNKLREKLNKIEEKKGKLFTSRNNNRIYNENSLRCKSNKETRVGGEFSNPAHMFLTKPTDIRRSPYNRTKYVSSYGGERYTTYTKKSGGQQKSGRLSEYFNERGSKFDLGMASREDYLRNYPITTLTSPGNQANIEFTTNTNKYDDRGLSYNSPKKEGVSQSVRILDFPSSHKREREGLNKYLNKRDEWGKNKNRGICIQIDQETQTIDKKDVLEWNEEGEKALMGVTSRTTLGEQEDRYTLRNYDPYKTNKQLSLGNHNLTAFHQNISTRKGGKRKSTNSAKQSHLLCCYHSQGSSICVQF